MTDVEATVQRYYGDRPVMQRIDDASCRWGGSREAQPSRSVAVRPAAQPGHRGHARACGTCTIAGRHVHTRSWLRPRRRVSLSRSTECGCRVAAIDLTPNFVEAAQILTARCGLRDRVEIRQANALALPFQDGTFDHVWSYDRRFWGFPSDRKALGEVRCRSGGLAHCQRRTGRHPCAVRERPEHAKTLQLLGYLARSDGPGPYQAPSFRARHLTSHRSFLTSAPRNVRRFEAPGPLIEVDLPCRREAGTSANDPNRTNRAQTASYWRACSKT